MVARHIPESGTGSNRAIAAFVGGSSGVREGVPVMTLADLVHPLALIKGRVIDYLDMDVQVVFDE